MKLDLTRRLEGRLRGRDDRGFLTIWLLGLCLLLLVLGGVSLDLWRVFSERQALAGLADSAALAGAGGLDPATDLRVSWEPGSSFARGGLVTARVTVESPAVSIPFLGGVGSFPLTATYSERVDQYRSGP